MSFAACQTAACAESRSISPRRYAAINPGKRGSSFTCSSGTSSYLIAARGFGLPCSKQKHGRSIVRICSGAMLNGGPPLLKGEFDDEFCGLPPTDCGKPPRCGADRRRAGPLLSVDSQPGRIRNCAKIGWAARNCGMFNATGTSVRFFEHDLRVELIAHDHARVDRSFVDRVEQIEHVGRLRRSRRTRSVDANRLSLGRNGKFPTPPQDKPPPQCADAWETPSPGAESRCRNMRLNAANGSFAASIGR